MRKKKGKWSPNEDKRLKVAVMFFGEKNWRNIAQYVPGRDHVQCRERYVIFLIRLSFLRSNQVKTMLVSEQMEKLFGSFSQAG